MDADKCASIQNTYWEVGGEKCVMGFDNLTYQCNDSNERILSVVDPNYETKY